MHEQLATSAHDDAAAKHWWDGEAGLREAMHVALPLMISSLSWTVMNFIDRLFLLEYSKDAVAAALPAGIMSFAAISFPLGVASYASTFVAQYFGAGRRERVGASVWQAVWIGIAAVPLALAFIPLAPWIFTSDQTPTEITRLEVEYFYTLSFSGGAMVLSAALSAFFSGRGHVRTVMIVDTLAAILNVVLDYCWIFGKAGFPEMGIAGAGWATTVAVWFKALVYFALFLRREYRDEFGTLAGWRFDWSLMRRLLRFGFAGGMQMALEVAAFGTFTVLVGRLGSDVLAATSLAFNVNNFAFMPIWGIGMAASTMVGRRLGENRPDLATRATWSCFALGAAYMLAICTFYVVFPYLTLALYKRQAADAEEYARIEALAVVLLRFVAAFGFFDAVNVCFAGALKGAGDTMFVFIASVGIAALGVLATYVGLEQGLGLYWCWSVLTAWVVLLGAAFIYRFLYGPWREMRVIEPEPVE
ncbi:MAG: MATE family efflux transporter [Planctomycetes bacterium]|nr:MATE family efflux transporter [Planctomycetota bacterium]